jgi:SMC interacting uncharacterized protein involved in chromosome segregation
MVSKINKNIQEMQLKINAEGEINKFEPIKALIRQQKKEINMSMKLTIQENRTECDKLMDKNYYIRNEKAKKNLI